METFLGPVEPYVIVFVLGAAIYVFYSYVYAPYQVLKRRGIKGPKPSAFLGNYKLLIRLKPMKFYDELYKKYGSLCGFYIGRQPCLMVTDVEMLKEILVKQFDCFMDRPTIRARVILNLTMGILPGMFTRKGDSWKRARHTLSPAFSAMKMKMVEPLVLKACDTLVEKFGKYASSKQSADVFKIYAAYTTETILSVAFGREIDVQEADKLTQAAASIFTPSDKGRALSRPLMNLLLDEFPCLEPLFIRMTSQSQEGKDFSVLHNTICSLVQERMKDGASTKYKDVLQLLIDACAEDNDTPSNKKLTEKEIVSNATSFLLAGYEDTPNCLAYTTYLLGIHPAVQDRLHTEIEEYFTQNQETSHYDACMDLPYLEMVIMESLRLYPVGFRIVRKCVKTTEVSGLVITKGTQVHIPIHVLHYNPQYWPDPDQFDPERFTPEKKAKRPQLAHIPFGWGPRNCIGMKFGLLKTKMALIEVLRRYKVVQTPDTEVPLETVDGPTVTAKNGIYLGFSLRN